MAWIANDWPLTARQQRIYRRLLLIGPGPAAFFLDACELVERPSLRSSSHLVGHLLREIESAVRDVLLPSDFKVDGNHPAKQRAELDAILLTLEISEDSPVAAAWRELARATSEGSLHRVAHRDNLAVPRPFGAEAREHFEKVSEILDVVLARFEERFLTHFAILDKLLSKINPTPADVTVLLKRVPSNGATLEYFFSRLDRSEWLPLLASARFFSDPPAPVVYPDRGLMSFPHWPAGQYLRRMADRETVQEQVVELALAIPPTDNRRVHQDLSEIALALPPHLGARLVVLAPGWLSAGPRSMSFVAENLAILVGKLADGGQIDAALALVGMLLESTADSPRPEGEALSFAKPQSAIEPWHYPELKASLEKVASRVGIRLVELLCGYLRGAILLSRSGAQGDGDDKWSALWRFAIEEHEENYEHSDPRDILVTAIRDVSEALVRDQPTLLRPLIELLEAQGQSVCRRLALHVLRMFAAVAVDLVAERLNETLLTQGDLEHEATLLAEAYFARIPEPARQRILEWIDAAPEVDEYAAYVENSGTGPTEEERTRYSRRWQLRQLLRLGTDLPTDWLRRRDELTASEGMPGQLGLLGGTPHWSGPTSPLSLAALQGMAVSEIVAFLKDWVPTDEPAGPSPAGLAQELTIAVAQDPAKFAAELDLFEPVGSLYLCAVADGLRNAARGGHPLPWAPVLKLLMSLTGSPELTQLEGSSANRSEARRAVVALLAAGLKGGPAEIPIELREQVWAVLRPLTDDPEPTPQYEREHLGRMTPEDLSMNTIRGEAMQAAIEYGLWVDRNAGESTVTQRSFSGIPELRDVLEQHLDPTVDPSVATRAVFGRRFPALWHLDGDWTKANVPRIFSTDDDTRLLDASWSAYLSRCRAHDLLFPSTRSLYRQAAERLAGCADESRRATELSKRLAEHLMSFLLRGTLDQDAPEVTLLFNHGSADVRGHAMAFLGRVLGRNPDLPPEFATRARALWEHRLEKARLDPGSHAKELEAFGTWLPVDAFPEAWRMEQFQTALTLHPITASDHQVLQVLVSLSATVPGPVISSLRLLVEGAPEPWTIDGWREEIRQILSAALRSSDALVQAAAKTLVSLLVAKGYTRFKELADEAAAQARAGETCDEQ